MSSPASGSPDRRGRHRRLRQVDPGPVAGRPARGPVDLRAGGHRARGLAPASVARSGTVPRSTDGPRRCSWRRTGPSTWPRWWPRPSDAGTSVVTDRFSASTLAYQGYGRGLDLEWLDRLVGWATGGVVPDVTRAHRGSPGGGGLATAPRPGTASSAREPTSSSGWPPATGRWPPAPRRPGWWSTARERWTRWRPPSGRGCPPRPAWRPNMSASSPAPPGRPADPDHPGDDRPAPSLFAEVVGQDRAVAQLSAAARRPVHAFLLHGPPGTGQAGGGSRAGGGAVVPLGRVRGVQHLPPGTRRHPSRPGGGRAFRCGARRGGGPLDRRPGPAPSARVGPPGGDGHRPPSGRTGGAGPAQDGGGTAAGHRVRAPRRPSSRPARHPRQPVRAGGFRPGDRGGDRRLAGRARGPR